MMFSVSRHFSTTRLAWVVAAVYAAALTYGLVAPHPLWLFGATGRAIEESVDRTIVGHVQHAAAYALFAGLLLWARRPRTWSGHLRWLGLAVSHGMVTEAIQMLVPARYGAWPDALANALGAGVGWMAGAWAIGFVTSRAWKANRPVPRKESQSGSARVRGFAGLGWEGESD